MSGGHFDYKNDYLCDEIFGYDLSPEYNLEGAKKLSRTAAKKNPFEDRVISELVFDVFCLMHSYDWFISGDTNESIYCEDVEYFKEKWLDCDNKELSKRIADESLEDCRDEMYKALGINTEKLSSQQNTPDDDDDEDTTYLLTVKGIISIAMIESGILDNIDDPRINGFYTLFENYMRKAGYVHDPEDE